MRAPPVCELAGTDPKWASCPRRHRPHLPYETCHGMMTRSPREARNLAVVFYVSLRVRVHLGLRLPWRYGPLPWSVVETS
jgi:hypothetical protein